MKYQYILLIDDDEDDQEFFELALKKLSDTVKFEGIMDATKALNKLSANQIIPDVIFLDLNMPIMSGFQFLTHLKKKDHLKYIPVIVYSTSSQNSTIEQAKELGAHDFITKPNNYQDLVNILRTMLV